MPQHLSIRFPSEVPESQASVMPDCAALTAGDEGVDYKSLKDRAYRVASMLKNLRIAPGDRVAWLGKNHLSWFDAFFGTALARACFTPLNNRLSSQEIAHLLEDSNAAVLFVTADCAALAEAALRLSASSPIVVTIGYERTGSASLDCKQIGIADYVFSAVSDTDHVLQLYTSGTTGYPKGVCLSNANYEAFLSLSPQIEGFDYKPQETVLIVMPLFHVAATNVVLAALAAGCHVVLLADFSAREALHLIEREKVSHIFLVPSMIQMIIDDPGIDSKDLSSLRTIGYGASPISESVLAQAQQKLGCSFIQFYGMTESTGSGTVLLPSMHIPALRQSCGIVWPGLEAAVRRKDGSKADILEIGEIMLRGRTIMAGYWRQPVATAEAIDSDGWLRTGDAGYRDEAGHFFIRDRMKNMIVSGGENLYPAEIENAIASHPAVSEVAVIGIPSSRWGEEACAVVVLAPGAEECGDAILAWTRDVIARYKVPKSIIFADSLPRNASGKILHSKLRAPFWHGRDRAIG